MDPNFNFAINLSGVAPASGGNKLEEGYHKGELFECFGTQSQRTGRPQVAVRVRITEGPGAGTVRTSYLGVPQTETDAVRHYWRALLESAGYTPAQIDQGAVTVNQEILIGRTVHIYYKPGDKDAGIYETIRFLSPNMWASRKQSFEATNTNGTTGGSALAAAGAPVQKMGIGSNGSNGVGAVTLAAPVGNQQSGVTTASLLSALNR